MLGMWIVPAWLVAAGCATGGLYVRDATRPPCTECDPAMSNPAGLDYRVVLVGDGTYGSWL
jgi:hypothetical protein